jgi:hypothetical protein
MSADSTGVSPANAAHTAQTQTYSPELTAFEFYDSQDPVVLVKGLYHDITPELQIQVLMRFSGNMQAITASSLQITGDSVGASAVSAASVASTDNNAFTFAVTLSDSDVVNAVAMQLNAPTVAFAWASASEGVASRTISYDIIAPAVTLSDTAFILTDATDNQRLDVLSTVVSGIVEAVSPTSRLTVSISSAPAVTGVLELSGCSSVMYSAGCVITGADANDAIPADSTGVSTITLTVTDEAGNVQTTTFDLARQAVISATGAISKLSKSGHFAPFSHPDGTDRQFHETLDDLCTSSSGADNIVVTVSKTDVSGSQAANCAVVNNQGKQLPGSDSDKPRIQCVFTAPGVVSWSVTCSEDLVYDTDAITADARFVDVPVTITGTWGIEAQTPPSVTAAGSFVYSENLGNKLLSHDISFSITDTEDANLRFMTVTRTDCELSRDKLVLSATLPASITGTLSADECSLAFQPSGQLTESPIADFVSAFNVIEFLHTSDNPAGGSGVTVVVNVTDDAGGETGTPESYALASSATIHFAIQEVNDPVEYLIGDAAITATAVAADTTTLHAPENAEDGACLQDGANQDLIFTVEDVDVIQHGAAGSYVTRADDSDIDLSIMELPGPSTYPDIELWSVVNITGPLLSQTSQTGSSVVPGATEQFVYKQFKICIAARGTKTSSGVIRARFHTLDYENLRPSQWTGMSADKKLPLRLIATSPSSENGRMFDIHYGIDNDPTEPPHFFHPEDGTVDVEGKRSGFYALQSQVEFYRSSLQPSFTLTYANLDSDSGNINADLTTYNMFRSPPFAEGDAYNTSYRPLDMVHGLGNRLEIETAFIVVEPDNTGTVELSVDFVGEMSRSGFSRLVSTAGQEAMAAGDVSTLGGLFSATGGQGFTLSYNSTHMIIEGTPTYGPTLNLSHPYPEAESAESKRLLFTLHARNSLSGLVSQQDFIIDVEVRGCMDIRGAYLGDEALPFLSADPATPFTFPDKTSPARYHDVSVATWRNPNGNFNPNATIPALCTFPPRAVSPGSAASFTISGATTETTAAGLEAALGSAPSAAALEQSRGFIAVGVPAGAATASIPLEVSGVTTNIAIAIPPPAEGAIVEADLSVKLGPCGQQFDDEVEVCVFVGAARASRFFVMYHASAVSCGNLNLGYAEFQPTTGNSYNAVTGKLCGKVTSFSIVSGVSLPVPATSQLESRFFEPGGGCPLDCNGRGSCIAYGKCQCFEGFGGYACTQRTCPRADAWASDSIIGRVAAECSGRGSCRESTGQCLCEDGYEGVACQRLACQNGCSGRGRCISVAMLPQAVGYSAWDAERSQACVCDPGYTGADCSLRSCPVGDDPGTFCTSAANAKVRATLALPISAATAAAGVYPSAGAAWTLKASSLVVDVSVASGAYFTTAPVLNVLAVPGPGASALTAALKAALTSLPSFTVDTAVSVSESGTSGLTRSFDIELAGSINPGNALSVLCPATNGCPAPGCRPRYMQTRLELEQVAAAGQMSVREATVVEPPATYNGVLKRVTISAGASGGQVFSVTSCPLQATSAAITEASGSCVTDLAKPVPLERILQTWVEIGHGVQLQFATTSPTSGVYSYHFVVGSCESSVVRRAGSEREAVECSNRGTCNRGSGLCECFEDYTGGNCGIMVAEE